jgi:hypothetical protein
LSLKISAKRLLLLSKGRSQAQQKVVTRAAAEHLAAAAFESLRNASHLRYGEEPFADGDDALEIKADASS